MWTYYLYSATYLTCNSPSRDKSKGRWTGICIPGLIEKSNVQSQNQTYLEDRENQYIDMTHVPGRFYRQVTYSNQKQACIQKQSYIFVKNDVIVPIENNRYAIYHDAMKINFRYNEKTKTFQQIDIQECELAVRHLFCQDAIFPRIIIPQIVLYREHPQLYR